MERDAQGLCKAPGVDGVESLVKWERPPSGWVKINSDGASNLWRLGAR